MKVVHRASGTVLAEGPTGWGMIRFDGGVYIRRRHLVGGAFSLGIIPGLCVYKGLYLSLDYTPQTAPSNVGSAGCTSCQTRFCPSSGTGSPSRANIPRWIASSSPWCQTLAPLSHCAPGGRD